MLDTALNTIKSINQSNNAFGTILINYIFINGQYTVSGYAKVKVTFLHNHIEFLYRRSGWFLTICLGCP